VSLNFALNTYVNHTVSSVSQPRLRIHEQMILERVHQVLGQMLRTAELDMANSVTPDDVDVFLDNAAWAIRSTYHMVLKAQVQPFLDKTCSSTFRSWLTGAKLEKEGNH
jgi:hypothetical protein